MFRVVLLFAWCVIVVAHPVMAQEASPSLDLAELERRLEVLAEEIERLKLGEVVVKAERSQYGFGPAASKVYRAQRGVSVGGYGEMVYQNFAKEFDNGTAANKVDELDFLRAIVYVGYKFDNRWLLNTEFEWEHSASDKGGELSVEFAYIDYLWRPQLNLRAGMLLVPMGLVNELHEPTVFIGARRPGVEQVIIPTTWRENGFGVFGNLGPLTYRTYVVNGFDGARFSAGGLRGGRQKGARAKADDFAWVGRLDYTATPGLIVGGSVYAGNSGQGQSLLVNNSPVRVGSARTTIVEGHLDWKWRGLGFRALGAQANIDDVTQLNKALNLTGNKSVGETLQGYSLQFSYDLLSLRPAGEQSLTPYVRWESYDTQHKVPAGFSRNLENDIESLTVGLAYNPITQVVFKVDYQNIDNGAKTGLNQVNAALGYIF